MPGQVDLDCGQMLIREQVAGHRWRQHLSLKHTQVCMPVSYEGDTANSGELHRNGNSRFGPTLPYRIILGCDWKYFRKVIKSWGDGPLEGADPSIEAPESQKPEELAKLGETEVLRVGTSQQEQNHPQNQEDEGDLAPSGLRPAGVRHGLCR